MSQLNHIENFQIEGAGAKIDGLHNYYGTFTSTSRNSRNFSLAPDTMADVVRQANAGVELRKSHRTYTDPIGKFISAHLTEDGKQGAGNFFVREGLQGPLSDDVIKMIDSEIMDSMSIGFAHTEDTKVMCDTCKMLGDTNQMKPKFTWFSYYFECDEGHILGRKSKVKKKEVLNTATYEGTIKLREISVVGTGADPNAKIIKKLQEELRAGNIELGDLNFFSESLNVELSHFNQLLGLDSPEPPPRKTYSIPNKRSKPVSEPTNALQSVVDELTNTVETQTERITELETELEDRPTQENYDELETELESVQSQLAAKESELETLKAEYEALTEDGTEAREIERARGHSYLKEYYGDNYKELPECHNHIKNLDDENSSVGVLRSLADGFRSMAVSKRPKGRQSRMGDRYVPGSGKKANGFKFKKGVNANLAA